VQTAEEAGLQHDLSPGSIWSGETASPEFKIHDPFMGHFQIVPLGRFG
jgi:hypothetical protein